MAVNLEAGWREASIAGTIFEAGSSVEYITGAWRTLRPVRDEEACTHCMICWVYCPDSIILVENSKVIGFDYDHCKGCGICAAECPVNRRRRTTRRNVPEDPERQRLGVHLGDASKSEPQVHAVLPAPPDYYLIELVSPPLRHRCPPWPGLRCRWRGQAGGGRRDFLQQASSFLTTEARAPTPRERIRAEVDLGNSLDRGAIGYPRLRQLVRGPPLEEVTDGRAHAAVIRQAAM